MSLQILTRAECEWKAIGIRWGDAELGISISPYQHRVLLQKSGINTVNFDQIFTLKNLSMPLRKVTLNKR